MFTVPNNSNSSNELISINSPILNDFEMADVSTDNTTSPKTSAMEVSASTTTNTTTTAENQELSANNEIRGAASLILLPSPAKNDVIPAEPFYENGVHRSGGSGAEKTSALSRKGSSSPANLIILNTPPSPTIKPYNDLLNGTQTDLLTHNQLALPSTQSTKNKTSAR